MIYGPGKKSTKDPQPILILANIGVGMQWQGEHTCIFLRFNTYLHNAYYVSGMILSVLYILTHRIPDNYLICVLLLSPLYRWEN